MNKWTCQLFYFDPELLHILRNIKCDFSYSVFLLLHRKKNRQTENKICEFILSNSTLGVTRAAGCQAPYLYSKAFWKITTANISQMSYVTQTRQTFCFRSPFVAWSTTLLLALWAIFFAMDNFHFLSDSNSCNMYKFKHAKRNNNDNFYDNLTWISSRRIAIWKIVTENNLCQPHHLREDMVPVSFWPSRLPWGFKSLHQWDHSFR